MKFKLLILILVSYIAIGEEVLEIRVGTTPRGSYTTSPESKSKSSHEIMVEYRKAITEQFQVGVGIGYQINGKIKEYTDVQDANLKVVVEDTKLYNSIPLYVTARYEFNKNGEWIPFIKANLGYSFNINNRNTNYYRTINKNNDEVLDSGYYVNFLPKMVYIMEWEQE